MSTSLSLSLLPVFTVNLSAKRKHFVCYLFKFDNFKQSIMPVENIYCKYVCLKVLSHMVKVVFWLKKRYESRNWCFCYHSVADLLWDFRKIPFPPMPPIPIYRRWDYYSLGFLNSFGISQRCSILWLIVSINISME